MELTRIPTSMISWLLKCFDVGSRMFSIDLLWSFQILEYDVHDVFCFPLNPNKNLEFP